jgi:Dna[CI] antecedent DciA-like protein
MAEPVRIGNLLTSFPGMAERLAEMRLLRAWPALAGAAGRRTRAEGIEHGVLHVAVDSSGWLHRLTLEETSLLARCRAIASIRAIHFHLAPVGAGEPPDAAGSIGASNPSTRTQGEVCP